MWPAGGPCAAGPVLRASADQRQEGDGMADRALFVGFGAPVRGREERAIDVFGELVAMLGRMQGEGRDRGHGRVPPRPPRRGPRRLLHGPRQRGAVRRADRGRRVPPDVDRREPHRRELRRRARLARARPSARRWRCTPTPSRRSASAPTRSRARTTAADPPPTAASGRATARPAGRPDAASASPPAAPVDADLRRSRLPCAGVPPGERVGLAVAVRAQQLQVLQPVVVADAVDVVQRQRERPAEPRVDPADLAARLLERRRRSGAA